MHDDQLIELAQEKTSAKKDGLLFFRMVTVLGLILFAIFLAQNLYRYDHVGGGNFVAINRITGQAWLTGPVAGMKWVIPKEQNERKQ